jgi:hypothetical protein
MQDDSAPVVGQPIQFYELDGTARQSRVTGRGLVMHARIAVMRALTRNTQPSAKRIAHKGIWVEPELLAEIEYRTKAKCGIRFSSGIREDL